MGSRIEGLRKYCDFIKMRMGVSETIMDGYTVFPSEKPGEFYFARIDYNILSKEETVFVIPIIVTRITDQLKKEGKNPVIERLPNIKITGTLHHGKIFVVKIDPLEIDISLGLSKNITHSIR